MGIVQEIRVTCAEFLNVPAQASFLKPQSWVQSLLLLHHTLSETGHKVKRQITSCKLHQKRPWITRGSNSASISCVSYHNVQTQLSYKEGIAV